MMLSDAPFFEDVLLQRCLESLAGLAYGEINPGDPVTDSVSQWFDLSGWRGIIVAPADRRVAWQAARPNATVISDDRTDDGENELWRAAKPFGFIRFAGPRLDAALLIATQPLVALSLADDDIEGYCRVRPNGGAPQTPRYLVRADHAEAFIPLLERPLARDEFRVTERQAAALAQMLASSASEGARIRKDFDHLREESAQRIAEIDRKILARDREIKTRNLDVQARDQDIQARDRTIATLDQDIQARDQDIMARDSEITTLHQSIAERDRELHELRPRAETLTRLALSLDWAEAPRALRAVLPLARILRRFGARRLS